MSETIAFTLFLISTFIVALMIVEIAAFLVVVRRTHAIRERLIAMAKEKPWLIGIVLAIYIIAAFAMIVMMMSTWSFL